MSLPPTPVPEDPDAGLQAARRRLLLDIAGIAVSAAGFGIVFGLSARNAGYSPVEAIAMSTIVFAGAAQFTAVGAVVAGLPWLPIVVLTAVLNARHLLYSASLAPRLRLVPFGQRAAMAHLLTDEAFALAASHFHRLGRVDIPGYWIGAVLGVFIPWNLATIVGVLLGGSIPDPTALGLDVIFPAAMAGLAAGLVTGRRELVAAGSAALLGVVLSVAFGPSIGIVVGGLVGPLLGMAVPAPATAVHADSPVALRASHMDETFAEFEAVAARPPSGQAAVEPPQGAPPQGAPRQGAPPRGEPPDREARP